MTANEMRVSLETTLDRKAFASPGYEDIEISEVLNLAFLKYLKMYFDEQNPKGKGFEAIEHRGQAFSALIKYSNSLSISANQTGVKPDGVFYDLPSDFMWTIQEDIFITSAQCSLVASKADVSVITHDEYNRFLDNSYKRPGVRLGKAFVWRMYAPREVQFYNPTITATPKRHQIIKSSDMTITGYKVSYLIYPPEIVVDTDIPTNQRHCILDESSHDTIVNIAADLMLEATYRQRMAPNVQTFE